MAASAAGNYDFSWDTMTFLVLQMCHGKKKTKKNDADGLRNISEDQGEPSSCKFLKHEICYFHVGLSEKMVPLNHIISLDIIVPLKTFFGYIYDGICHSETQP